MCKLSYLITLRLINLIGFLSENVFLQFLIKFEDESNFVYLMFLVLCGPIGRSTRNGLLKDQKNIKKNTALTFLLNIYLSIHSRNFLLIWLLHLSERKAFLKNMIVANRSFLRCCPNFLIRI